VTSLTMLAERRYHDRSVLDQAAYRASARLGTRGWQLRGVARRTAFALTHPHLVPAYFRLLRELPTELVELSDRPAGRVLRRRWAHQSWRKAASHACLRLPSELDLYLRGRRRQAVRTNLHRANAIQLTCRTVTTDRRAIENIVKDNALATALSVDNTDSATGAVVSWAVFDRANRRLGHAVALVDERTAVLLSLQGPRDLAVAYQTRYLLHTTVVADLIQRGVQHLIIESILGAPPGHKYFAARLGYRACRIRITNRQAPGEQRAVSTPNNAKNVNPVRGPVAGFDRR
jgi:hypothetical protein